MSLVSLPVITRQNIQEYITSFFTVSPEQHQALLDIDWTKYKFFTEAVTFEYILNKEQHLIKCYTKHSLPTGITQEDQQSDLNNITTDIFIPDILQFIELYKKHFTDTYSYIHYRHKYQAVLIDRDIHIEANEKDKILMIGQNKYMYAYKLKKTYIFHVTCHIPYQILKTFDIDITNFKYHKSRQAYKLLSLINDKIKDIKSLDDIYIRKNISESNLIQMDKTLYNTASIPNLYLSKTFIPKAVSSKDVSLVNSQTINLLKKFNKISSKLFKLFK
jgi:hypothetical protein